MNLSENSNRLINDRKSSVDEYIRNNLRIDDETLNESVRYLFDAGGKRIRPIVFLLSAELIDDINYNEIIPIAAGFEALHTASLIQDDHPSMDNHSMRRGVKTVHRKYDPAVSVMSSDILRSKATTWCTRVNRSGDIIKRVIEEFDRTVEEMCIGQKQDIRFERSYDSVSVDDYLNMASGKTAKIYSSCAKCGVMVAGGTDEEEEILEEFGRQLGLGFQIVDDILDVESEDTGKDERSDIRNNKKTMVTIHAHNSGKPIFSGQHSVEEKVEMIKDAGSVEYAKSVANKKINNAINLIRNGDFNGSSESAKTLIEIAEATKNRER